MIEHHSAPMSSDPWTGRREPAHDFKDLSFACSVQQPPLNGIRLKKALQIDFLAVLFTDP
jgi:hypothetical protein